MGKNRRRLQLAIMLLVLIVAGLTVAGNRTKADKYPKIGDRAPGFILTGIDGQTHQLSDYKGKTVVLNFWATYCGPCRQEMPAIQQQANKWSNAKVAVLGVNIAENRITVQSFLDQIGVKFPVLLDDQEDVRRRYGVKDYPTTFFIGPDGTIKSVKVGQMEESYLESTLSDLLTTGKGAGL